MSWDGTKAKEKPTCPKCGNRLRLRADQDGTEVKCPKCNFKFMVGQPAASPASPDDPYEPEVPLKRATIVHEEYRPLGQEPDEPPASIMPMNPPVTAHLPQYTADWATDELEVETPAEPPPSLETDYLEIARERGLIRSVETRSRPKWTFFTGVFGFPWQSGNVTRWTIMAAGLTVTGLVLVVTVEELRGGVRTGTLMLPLLSALLAGMTLVTLAACAPCFLAAVDDTADGHDDVQDETLPPLDQWFFSFFSLLWLWLVAGALGYPLALVPQIGPPVILVSSFLLFPVLTLSAMECDSFLLPWSPRIWGSLLGGAGTWLAFYVVSTCALAAWYVPMALALPHAPYLVVLVAGPALAAVMLIYGRLLGRLGWQISGGASRDPARPKRRTSPPVQNAPPIDTDRKPPVAEPRPTKRKNVRRINIPDDIDAPQSNSGTSAPPPPRLDFHRKP